MPTASTMTKGAVVSDDGLYRYCLWREWSDGPVMAFIMLNPSTADAESDDPTIRRCLSFAEREGCGRIEVVNLYALRSTDPAQLLVAGDPSGPDNERWVRRVVRNSDVVVVAWGAWRSATGDRPWHPEVAAMGVDLSCLGKTKAGEPRHPLYVRGDQELIAWP